MVITIPLFLYKITIAVNLSMHGIRILTTFCYLFSQEFDTFCFTFKNTGQKSCYPMFVWTLLISTEKAISTNGGIKVGHSRVVLASYKCRAWKNLWWLRLVEWLAPFAQWQINNSVNLPIQIITKKSIIHSGDKIHPTLLWD